MRATKKLIEDTYTKEGELRIRFTTIEQLKLNGITGEIREDRRKRFGV